MDFVAAMLSFNGRAAASNVPCAHASTQTCEELWDFQCRAEWEEGEKGVGLGREQTSHASSSNHAKLGHASDDASAFYSPHEGRSRQKDRLCLPEQVYGWSGSSAFSYSRQRSSSSPSRKPPRSGSSSPRRTSPSSSRHGSVGARDRDALRPETKARSYSDCSRPYTLRSSALESDCESMDRAARRPRSGSQRDSSGRLENLKLAQENARLAKMRTRGSRSSSCERDDAPRSRSDSFSQTPDPEVPDSGRTETDTQQQPQQQPQQQQLPSCQETQSYENCVTNEGPKRPEIISTKDSVRLETMKPVTIITTKPSTTSTTTKVDNGCNGHAVVMSTGVPCANGHVANGYCMTSLEVEKQVRSAAEAHG